VQLFRRFPRVQLRPYEAQDIIKPADREKYSAFAQDFAVLDKELVPSFREFDSEAQRRQNWYRWMYVILIFGGSLTTILIIVQIAFLGIPGFDIAGTIVAAVLGFATALSRSFNHHGRYLNARLAAEQLRSEYFLFLGYLDKYGENHDRLRKLRERVFEIRHSGRKTYESAR